MFDLVVVGVPEVEKFIGDRKVCARQPRRPRPLRRRRRCKSRCAEARHFDARRGEESVCSNAKSVAYSTGPSGVYVRALFDKLGVAGRGRAEIEDRPLRACASATISSKAKPISRSSRSANCCTSTASTISVHCPPKFRTTRSIPVVFRSTAKQPDASRALQAFLRAANAAPAYKKNGMEQAQ